MTPLSGRIFLCGMKHSGKTTLGKRVASRKGSPFFDSDTLLEDEYARHGTSRLSCRDIYARHGAGYFRQLEAQALKTRFIGMTGMFICATGGGICDNPEAVDFMKSCGALIFLHLEKDVLFRRIERAGIPPFLNAEDPMTDFSRLYDRRVPLYLETADGIIVLPDQPVEDSVLQVSAALEGK